MTRPRIWILVALWVSAFAVALALDGPVSEWVKREPVFNPKRNSIWKVPKRLGEFQYILPVIVAVAVFHQRRWRGAVMLLAASGIAGVAYSVLKWAVGRSRPTVGAGPFSFDPFTGGLPGLITSGNLAFPSGHAAFAFAVAAGMAILIPQWRWAFFLLAAMCGGQRVLEYAHHPSDIVASALLGVAAAYLAERACRYWLPEPSNLADKDGPGAPGAPSLPTP